MDLKNESALFSKIWDTDNMFEQCSGLTESQLNAIIKDLEEVLNQ